MAEAEAEAEAEASTPSGRSARFVSLRSLNDRLRVRDVAPLKAPGVGR